MWSDIAEVRDTWSPIGSFCIFPLPDFPGKWWSAILFALISTGERRRLAFEWLRFLFGAQREDAEKEGWQILMEPLMPALKWWNCWQDRCLSSDKRLRCYLQRLVRVPPVPQISATRILAWFFLCVGNKNGTKTMLNWVESNKQFTLPSQMSAGRPQ